MKKEFKVGDVLQVKRPGAVYSTYDKMFQRMGFLDTITNEGFEENTIVQVFNTDYHPDFGNQMCAVRDMNGNEALYGREGLEEIMFKRLQPKSIKVQLGDYTAEVFENCIKVGCQTIYISEFDSLVAAAHKIGFIK